MTLTRLDLQYDAAVRRVWTSVLNRVGRSWTDMGSWRGSDVKAFQRTSLPILKGGQRQVASLTATYLEQLYRDIADESSRVELDFDKVSGAAIRNGTEPEEVYERPFKEVWTALSNGEPLDAALDRGGNRLDSLLKTDLQLTRTHAAREIALDQPQVTYTIREPIGERNCALCLIASTQRYRKRELLPIHPGCDCLVKIVTADYDPGQVIDEDKLDAIHKAVDDALGQHDRGGRAVDYRKIIVAHEHGEIGPVLSFRDHKFTGPEDIGKDRKRNDTPASAPAEPRATVSDDTRNRMDTVRSELPKTREDWLNARRTETAPRMRNVDARITEEESKLEALREERGRIVEETTAEFKRKRTPIRNRDALLEDATWSVDHRIGQAERYIEELRQIATQAPDDADPNRRYLLTERPAEHAFTYRVDENGRLLPPENYEAYLDSVLSVGRSLDDDLTAAIDSDEHLTQLRGQLEALEASGSPSGREARQRLRREIRRRESQLVHALLRDVRSMDGTIGMHLGDASSLGSGSGFAPGNWEAQMAEALRHFPSSWLQLMSDTNLHIVGSDRAFYSEAFRGNPDFMALATVDVPSYDGAFSGYAAEVATHELGHRMEQYVPGLRELEYVLVRRRAMIDGNLPAPRNLAELSNAYDAAAKEMTYEDEWASAYTGKTYEAYANGDPANMSSEAFQVGLQDLFGRGSRVYGADELRRFVLAVLALL